MTGNLNLGGHGINNADAISTNFLYILGNLLLSADSNFVYVANGEMTFDLNTGGIGFAAPLALNGQAAYMNNGSGTGGGTLFMEGGSIAQVPSIDMSIPGGIGGARIRLAWYDNGDGFVPVDFKLSSDATYATLDVPLHTDFIGNLTGDVAGNVTGGVTGDIIGNVTGNLTIPSNGTITATDNTVITNLAGSTINLNDGSGTGGGVFNIDRGIINMRAGQLNLNDGSGTGGAQINLDGGGINKLAVSRTTTVTETFSGTTSGTLSHTPAFGTTISYHFVDGNGFASTTDGSGPYFSGIQLTSSHGPMGGAGGVSPTTTITGTTVSPIPSSFTNSITYSYKTITAGASGTFTAAGHTLTIIDGLITNIT
jgi:hypothetical protein